jgi:L-threonylcarbamoyladenylate synthase
MPAERILLSQLLTEGNGSADLLDRFAWRIREGAIFIYPTETIYGIGGRADNQQIESRILEIKKRPPESPMILLAADRKAFEHLSPVFPRAAETLAQKFWPGSLTLVLPSPHVPQGIGIRVSPHPFMKLLHFLIDKPVFSTSANISGQPYTNDPDRIFQIFRNDVDFMIDDGILPVSAPSTVVRVTEENRVEIIREGAVSRYEIEKALTEANENI